MKIFKLADQICYSIDDVMIFQEIKSFLKSDVHLLLCKAVSPLQVAPKVAKTLRTRNIVMTDRVKSQNSGSRNNEIMPTKASPLQHKSNTNSSNSHE